MSLYEPVDIWEVPANLLHASIRAMAQDGYNGNEGLVMWLGVTGGGIAKITHYATFSEHWVTKRPDFLQIESDGMNALANCAESLGTFLIGQIHSHPGNYTDLSAADRRYGIAVPYYLSVVAPHYAQDPSTPWSACGLHIYQRGIGFRRLSSTDAATKIRVADAFVAGHVYIGGAQ